MPEDRPKGGQPPRGDRLTVRKDAHRELEFRYSREERLGRGTAPRRDLPGGSFLKSRTFRILLLNVGLLAAIAFAGQRACCWLRGTGSASAPSPPACSPCVYESTVYVTVTLRYAGRAGSPAAGGALHRPLRPGARRGRGPESRRRCPAPPGRRSPWGRRCRWPAPGASGPRWSWGAGSGPSRATWAGSRRPRSCAACRRPRRGYSGPMLQFYFLSIAGQPPGRPGARWPSPSAARFPGFAPFRDLLSRRAYRAALGVLAAAVGFLKLLLALHARRRAGGGGPGPRAGRDGHGGQPGAARRCGRRPTCRRRAGWSGRRSPTGCRSGSSASWRACCTSWCRGPCSCRPAASRA